MWADTLDANTTHKVTEGYTYGVSLTTLDAIGENGRGSHHSVSLTRSLFRCSVEGEACFNTTESDTSGDKVAVCATGHEGNLCGECMHGYTAGYNELCSLCNANMEEFTVTDWIPTIVGVLLFTLLVYTVLDCTSVPRAQAQCSLDNIRKQYRLTRSAYRQAAKLQGVAPPSMDEIDGCVDVYVTSLVCDLLMPCLPQGRVLVASGYSENPDIKPAGARFV
jgi:hypothetical protein